VAAEIREGTGKRRVNRRRVDLRDMFPASEPSVAAWSGPIDIPWSTNAGVMAIQE